MKKQISTVSIPDETVMNKIYLIRNAKIMVDRDLAELYGVDTKVLKQSVKRNISRFPDDFMFEMTGNEFSEWRQKPKNQPIGKEGNSARR